MKLKKKDFWAVLLISALISILVYVIVRTTLVVFAEYNFIEKFFAVLLTLGEGFVLVHAFGYILNVLRSFRKKEISPPAYARLEKEPSVAVLVAARHEPKDVLAQTFITLYSLNYRNKTIYFLDDSSDEKYKKEAEELAAEYNLQLFRRKERHGAKAGIINDCLKSLTQDYVAVFDADQNPMPDFLNALIPMLEKDEKLAFVQTPQFYSNIEENRIARASAFQQAVFYEYICEGKNISGSMFCCGTNIVFRRKALMDVGGLDESTVTEDFATSVRLHTAGWRSLYYNHVAAFGMGPVDLTGYFKQQFRWAIGTISVLRKIIFKFLTKPFSLRPGQWWEYFLSSTYYLIGIAFFFLMVCPITYLLFNIPSFFAKAEIYFLVFIPYIILTMTVFYGVLKQRSYQSKDLFIGQLLASITFTVYIRAALCALIGYKASFGITEKTKSKAVAYLRLWPQLLIIFAHFIAVVWGVNRFIYEKNPAIAVNAFWSFYHFMFLSGGIFYFNKGI